MAIDRLNSMLAGNVLEQALKGEYDFAKKVSRTDPRPIHDVVCRDGKYGETVGHTDLISDGKQIHAQFERYSSRSKDDPTLRVFFNGYKRHVVLDISKDEVRISKEDYSGVDMEQVSDLPYGMLAAPGADIVLYNKRDAKDGREKVRAQIFTLVRPGERTIFYRPVHDDYLLDDKGKPIRVESIPEISLKELDHLSGRAAAKIAEQLDPFIEIGSLEFYKPVELKPFHPLAKEVAHIIAEALS